MSIFDALTDNLLVLADHVPVELFTMVGAFVEELVAPIPSPIIMTLAGSIAEAKGEPIMFVLWLALLGAIAKTIASFLLYLIVDKMEDVFVTYFGKFMGIKQNDMEKIGKRFSGGMRDDILIFLSRAIPIIPTAPISVVSGLVHLPLKNYLASTFLGLIIRNAFYLYLGYAGLAGTERLLSNMESTEDIVTVLLVIVLGGGIGLYLYKKKKETWSEKLQHWISERLGR